MFQVNDPHELIRSTGSVEAMGPYQKEDQILDEECREKTTAGSLH